MPPLCRFPLPGDTDRMRISLVVCSCLVFAACGKVESSTDASPNSGVNAKVNGGIDSNVGGYDAPISTSDADVTPDAYVAPDAAPCNPGVNVAYTGTALPAGIRGFYNEAFDCARAEGGAWFGGVNYMNCMRKADGSAWRIWNTGCGWEIGEVAYDPSTMTTMWQRYARTYSGQCASIPSAQLTTAALTTSTYYDGFGNLLTGISSVYDSCQ